MDPLLGLRVKAPDMRSLNGIQLLNLIREHGPISRAALAKLSGLSKPTVSEQVARLIAFRTVHETGPGEVGEGGGKRPRLVAFNADGGRVAGISVGAAVTRVVIADLQGNILRHSEMSTAPEQGARNVWGRIERALSRLLARDGRAIHAIGIGVPGRVDCRAGTVLESGSVFDWRNVDLRTPFHQRFQCPVSVDNDVNVALMAELHRGAAREADTAVLIRAETGIGSAVAIRRRIHHGGHWAAGEIGHLPAGVDASDHTSPRGDLESVLGADQIAQRVRAAASRSSCLRNLARQMPEICALFTAASKGDGAAQTIASELSGLAAIPVINQAIAYDPDIVLLSGNLFRYVMDDIRECVARAVPWSSNIQSAHFGEEGVEAGAVDMALVAAYEQMSRRLSADALAGKG